MKMHTRLWLVFLVVAGLVLGSGGVTSAQTNPFPTTKEPSSAKFDISGFYDISMSGSSLGDLQVKATISGSGAISGKNMQLEYTVSTETPQAPEGFPGAGSPSSFTLSMIVLDGKIYFKFPFLTGEDEWVVIDAAELGLGNEGTSGMMGGSTGLASLGGIGGLTGFDPKYAEAYTVTQEGKEEVNGAPTTKYRIDVDYVKLTSLIFSDLGVAGLTPPSSATTPPFEVKYVMHMWVGDNDMYLYKMTSSMEMTGTSSELNMRLVSESTIAFREFDQPVTITAPANAKPFDTSIFGGGSIVPTGGVVGMPGTVSTGIEIGMPRIGTGMAGMPRTGAPAGSFPFEAIVAGLGLLCLTLGGVARRASARR